jgi:3-oxoacyl-(acyl-carrier-protein) synthase
VGLQGCSLCYKAQAWLRMLQVRYKVAYFAGVLVLETLDHAKKRKAPIIAELRGFGTSSDSFHVSQPSPGGEGPALAISRALQDAGLEVDAVDYINAHATSTPQGDAAEVAAICKVCMIKICLPISARDYEMSTCNIVNRHLQ